MWANHETSNQNFYYCYCWGLVFSCLICFSFSAQWYFHIKYEYFWCLRFLDLHIKGYKMINTFIYFALSNSSQLELKKAVCLQPYKSHMWRLTYFVFIPKSVVYWLNQCVCRICNFEKCGSMYFIFVFSFTMGSFVIFF